MEPGSFSQGNQELGEGQSQALDSGVRGSEAPGESGMELVGGGQSRRISDLKSLVKAAITLVSTAILSQ